MAWATLFAYRATSATMAPRSWRSLSISPLSPESSFARLAARSVRSRISDETRASLASSYVPIHVTTR